jgi:hypothetical protein
VIEFRGGPASHRGLALERAPLFLRAVVGPDRSIDGLDQPDDAPEPGEQIYVYERTEYRGRVHINLGRKGAIWTHSATYRWRDDIDGETVRDNAAWRAWAIAAAQLQEGRTE